MGATERHTGLRTCFSARNMMEIDKLISQLGPWAFIVYILGKEVLPKVFPDIVKLWSKRQSVEDRLFTLLAENISVNTKLVTAIDGMGTILSQLVGRVVAIEETMKSSHGTCPQEQKERHIGG